MGVPSLWKELTPSNSSTLVELAWKDGFLQPDGSRHLKLGIDASIWLFQVKTANSDYPLHALFYRLASLFRLPIRPLFVFDGNARPDVKRGKTVPKTTKGGGMANERAFREMIDAFGFDSWTAPGEAEAELAYLSSEGSLDAVQTEDVDVLIFGATVVYVSTKSKKGYLVDFQVYDLIDLEEVHQTSHHSLVLAALMSGGDYDQKGSKQFGPKKALALGRAGFADQLYDAYNKLPRSEFTNVFLPRFRTNICEELRTNSTGFLGKKFKADADLLASSDTFPDVSILEQYVHPITSGTTGQARWPGFHGKESRGALDGLGLADLGRIMERELKWEGKDVVLKRGCARIWEGAVRRAMMQEIDQPGTWSRECERLGLTPLPSSSSGNHRMDEFFDPVGHDPSTSTSLPSRRRSGESDDDQEEKKRKPGSRPFGDSYAFLLNIKKKRLHANTGEALEEYQCVFDTSRFNVETVHGLTNGGIIDPSDVKPRSFSSAPSLSQPRAGPSSSKVKGKGKGRAPRRVASDPEMEEEEEQDEDFTNDMEYANAHSSLAEASHRDGDFQPSGGREDASGEEGGENDDDEEGSSSPSGKPRSKSKSKPTPPFNPTAPVILWIPALILQLTHPDKIAEFEGLVAFKEQKKKDLLAAKVERARVKEAKAEELRQGAGLMNSWVTKGVKPRPMEKGKGQEKEVVRAPSLSSGGGSARGGSAAPSRNSSKGSVPPLAEVIDISDDSEDERQAPLPKSPSPKRTTSFRRVPSRLPDFPPPVASSSKLPVASSSTLRSLQPTLSASSSTSHSDRPHPSKLQKRSPLKRTLSALSASIPDTLSDDEFDDGFPLDAFDANPAFNLGTPDRKRRAVASGSTSGAPYSPARRLSPMRSLSPSPATKRSGMEKGRKGKEREMDSLPLQGGLSRSKLKLGGGVKQEIFDLDSDAEEANTKPKLGSTPLAFSSPPPRPKPRSSPSKRNLGSLPPQSSSSRNKLPPLKSRPDVFSSTTSSLTASSSTTSISCLRKPTKPTYVEMDDD
ncbi:hypothetical protein BDY24DRAFT_127648 [Mrakia frigida]|uniref:uncharacterized protein n=1 Tax=Mrakia frigida TaxID=29902 RepID=UPI003FCBF477